MILKNGRVLSATLAPKLRYAMPFNCLHVRICSYDILINSPYLSIRSPSACLFGRPQDVMNTPWSVGSGDLVFLGAQFRLVASSTSDFIGSVSL